MRSVKEECIAKLKELKAIGYIVPDYAIKALEEELNELIPKQT